MPNTRPREIPQHAVDRPALRSRLDSGMAAPLSLVVAPAGAGKTVLLTQWALGQPDAIVAWFDIASSDTAVAGFAAELVAGIAAVAPEFLAPSTPVSATAGRLGEAFLEDLAGNLADLGPIVLVFDDLDRLPAGGLLTDLWRMVDLLPPNVHAVFSSRVDLQLGWSRHRLRHGLVEIRQRELAFDTETTAQVLESITGHEVADDLAAAVTARTEGWAVGVQLTALSLRFATEPDHLGEGFTDTDRLVVDYFSEEVLDPMDPARRAALMRLAVLDEVSAGLVEAVADVPGAEFLERLGRDSLFIVPVPSRPGWFRFHHLFRDLLLYRLRATDGPAESRVHLAAADWYAARGEIDDAVECLLRARSWERVLDTVLRSGRDVYEDTRTATVARWLSSVPEEVRATRPDAELLLAITLSLGGHPVLAASGFHGLLANDALTIGQRQVALSYIAAGVQFEPNAEVFLDSARRALALLQEHPDAELPDLMGLTSRAMLIMTSRVSLARALLLLGRLVEARDALLAAVDSGLLTYAPYRVQTLGCLALVEAMSGRLVSAAGHADEALEAARDFDLLAHPAPSEAFLARAVVAIERDEPAAAAIALSEGELRAAANHRTQLMWIAHLAARMMDLSGAAFDEEPPGPPPPLVRRGLTALELRRSRRRGIPSSPRTPATTWTAVAFEEVAALLASGDAAAARVRLAHFGALTAPVTPLAAVEMEVLGGWLCIAEGRRANSRDRFAAALLMAEQERLLHPFTKVGPQIVDALEEAPGGRSEFGRVVTARLRAMASPRDERPVDDLTPRELELLTYLPSRYTVADIAAHCFVSTNTIKTHLGHIYRKLGVTGRDAAIERAIQLGLLDAHETTRLG